MNSRKVIRITADQLVDVYPQPGGRNEWRCRLCQRRASASDRDAALSQFMDHLSEGHNAHSGDTGRKEK